MENFGYLERGTLIQVGTILKMEVNQGVELREVVVFHAHAERQSYGRTIYNFSVELDAGRGDGYPRSYDKQDLEEMLDAKTLKIYNES